jgi:[protein-PII] uridylyltransferase
VDLAREFPEDFRAVSRQDCLAAARTYAQEQRVVVRARHDQGESGSNVVRMLTAAADTLLRGVFTFALANVPHRRTLLSRLSLSAHGGYGREQLSPYSDLDVCLLHEGEMDDHLQELNGFLVPFLWDVGFDVCYATRSVEETFALARDDVRVFTGILEGRLMAGDATPFARLRLLIRELQPHHMAPLFDQLRARLKMDDMPAEYRELYHPVPNLKEGAGGLRDYHVALWLLNITHGIRTMDAVAGQGIISQEEHLELTAALDFIWRIRNELHFHAGRAADVLSYSEQKHIAQAFGYGGGEEPHIARLMEDYYSSARAMHRFLRIAVQACDPTALHEIRDRLQEQQEDISVIDGALYAAVDDPNWFAENPARLMRVFWECARHQVGLSRQTEREVARNLHLVNDAFRESDLVRRLFLAICNRPLAAGAALRQADHAGLLGRYLPEFDAVKNVIRYEDFHHYPVDEHTLRALEALAALPTMEGVVPTCLRRSLEYLSDPYILVLGILFHDLGKAEGDIHVAEGVRLAWSICRRIGLSEEDTERIAFLVENHLLMTSISQYRDTDDEHIVRQFAQTMRTEERLRALFLLSYADMAAVGPNVWNDWKGTLLMKLYMKTEKMLLGRAESASEAFWASPKADAVRERLPDTLRDELELHLRDLGDRYFVAFSPEQIAAHVQAVARARENGLDITSCQMPEAGMSDVVVSTRDRHGLFATIAGSFASQLVDINNAALFTRSDGFVVDCFTVKDAARDAPLTERQLAATESVLRKTLLEGQDIQDYVEKSRRRLFALLQPVIPVETRIDFDNASSLSQTVIDIRTGDRTGLLYDIARAIADAGMDISTARIVTDARRVRDSFYVSMNGNKVESRELQDSVRAAVHQAIHPRAVLESKGESQ